MTLERRDWPRGTERRSASRSRRLAQASPGTHEPTGHETVLVLDREQVLRGVLADILRQSGYRVLEASGGIEAQRLANEERIDLLILDLETIGLELARWFRAIHPQTKVLVTSSALWDLNYRIGDIQEIAFLSKPFTPPKLVRLVRRVLEQSAA